MAADSKNEVLKKPELPDVQTLERVVKKHHERREYLRILRSTVASLLVVAAVAVIISMLFLPVLRVTGTSMTRPCMTTSWWCAESVEAFRRAI